MAHLLLTKGFVAEIDDADYEWLLQWKWTAVVTGKNIKRVYAYRRANVERKVLYLHRFILGAPAGSDVDHINGDTLDNRRGNLRIATRSQNLANNRRAIGASGFRGVTRTASGEKMPFATQFRGRVIGRFETAQEAARAYDDAARKEFGPFAKLNFPSFARNEQELAAG